MQTPTCRDIDAYPDKTYYGTIRITDQQYESYCRIADRDTGTIALAALLDHFRGIPIESGKHHISPDTTVYIEE